MELVAMARRNKGRRFSCKLPGCVEGYEAAIRKVDTVDEVLGEIKKWKTYLLRNVAQRLCYQKDEWDWEMIDEYIYSRDESSRPNEEIWAEKLDCQ